MRRVALFAAIPFVALALLRAFEVPIGQPFFLIYRYSPWLEVRLWRATPALIVGGVAVYALYKQAAREAVVSRGMTLSLLGCFALLSGWTFFAPPQYVAQHTFNLLSPSHDGAFVTEARHVDSIRVYVGRGFYDRLQESPEEMRGRRVLSNPPGMTVVAVFAKRAVERIGWMQRALIDVFGLHELEDPQQRTQFASAMLLALFLTGLWGAAVLFVYPLCRLWLTPTAAMCVAFAAVFNPATVSFTPGKDPAQLFFVAAILFGIMTAAVRGQWHWAAVAGMAGAIGSTIGLIHLWVMAIALATTFWRSWRERGLWPWLIHVVLPFCAGLASIMLVAYMALDWNIPRTVYHVALRYGEIQLPIITEPFYWTLVGLPMFLLFVGAQFWGMVAVPPDADDAGARLGLALLAVTAGVMAYTYFFANNSETPRLWIPFILPLLLGLALRRSYFRQDHMAARRLHILLIALHLAITLAHWSTFDARESEWRLHTGRMWN